jgi:hypothetical protein
VLIRHGLGYLMVMHLLASGAAVGEHGGYVIGLGPQVHKGTLRLGL